MRFSIAGSKNILKAWFDSDIGRIEVKHNGRVTWDELQALKNAVWGEAALAIEIYPPKAELVNSGNYRHLWRWNGDAGKLPSLVDEGSRL